LLVNNTIKGIKMKLVGDSSLHFVPLRMTDICVVEGEKEVGGCASNLLLSNSPEFDS